MDCQYNIRQSHTNSGVINAYYLGFFRGVGFTFFFIFGRASFVRCICRMNQMTVMIFCRADCWFNTRMNRMSRKRSGKSLRLPLATYYYLIMIKITDRTLFASRQRRDAPAAGFGGSTTLHFRGPPGILVQAGIQLRSIPQTHWCSRVLLGLHPLCLYSFIAVSMNHVDTAWADAPHRGSRQL